MSLRVHHLNCGTMCPRGGSFMGADPGEDAKMCCHCLLIESNQGLILVDTGMGLDEVQDPSLVSANFRFSVLPKLLEEETAIRQVQALGFSEKDVRHVLVTHMDIDHAGGLPDFPEAAVHIYAPELDAARNPPTLWEAQRYSARQFEHVKDWRPYRTEGERWKGFACARELDGLPPEILLLPMTGHSRGHSAWAIDLGDRTLVHAGDAYFYYGEVTKAGKCPWGLEAFQQIAAVDNGLRKQNRARLRELAIQNTEDVQLVCAHDPRELAAAQRRAG